LPAAKQALQVWSEIYNFGALPCESCLLLKEISHELQVKD